MKVARQFDYADAFKVELVLPPSIKGVSADDDHHPGGPERGEDGRCRCPPARRRATVPNLIVRAVAIVNGNVPLDP